MDCQQLAATETSQCWQAPFAFLDPSLMESIFYSPTMRNVLFQPIDDGSWQNAQVWSREFNFEVQFPIKNQAAF
ncbi:hypothetical protein, partial [Aeromonas caviae]|uniref:hypothetical protein n=1 Tax=Aeromonas caviae TaxID=648 RepID=UPI002B477D88